MRQIAIASTSHEWYLEQRRYWLASQKRSRGSDEWIDGPGL